MKDQKLHKNILIFGTDPFGLMTYYTFKNDHSNTYKVKGFIDLNVDKKLLEDLKVFDLKEITSVFVEKKSIDEIVIAVQNIETITLFDIANQLSNLNIKLKIIPPIEECINGFIEIDQIKDLEIEDLLFRKPNFDLNPSILESYENQIIMITGAAGSIGGELAKKLTQFHYKEIILIDNAESPLYNLQQDLIQKRVSNFKVFVADIRDYNRMEQLFNLYKPKIIFHAAAYKHVPLMEEHPYEAVNVNVIGTKNVADLSVKYSVHKFIFISTDKAVNPTNVMGASKRVAELYLKCLKGKGQTKFITTRFGNVLASNGSVLPLFKKQIEAGGPITVTLKDIERYFMTITEACDLIIEAGTMDNSSDVLVFEMGQPIKIYDLAVLMIRLCGLQFQEHIDIKISGLRPGEKVNEELFSSIELAKSTYHPKIKVAQSKNQTVEDLEFKILELYENVNKYQNLELVAKIKSIVPEFISNNSKFEVLDSKKSKL